MSATIASAREKANGGGSTMRALTTRSVDASAVLADCCRTVFGRKTWAQVSALLGLSERAAKSRLACEREYTADEIRDLLQSEQGIHFLVALMGEARPAWWVSLLRMGMLGGIARRRAADLRLLKRVADADRSSPIKAAQMVQDEDFFGPVLEAFDAVSRAQSRAVDADS
jgi:hypothetical protein